MIGLSSNERDMLKGWLIKRISASPSLINKLVNAFEALVIKKQDEYYREMIGSDEEVIMPFGPDFADAWEEWLIYRKKNKFKKYKTPQRQLNKIVNLSGGNEKIAIAILDQSMDQNWQGLFAIKTNIQRQNEYSEIKAGIAEKYGKQPSQ